MLANVNYKARTHPRNVCHLPFRHLPPVMYTETLPNGSKIVIFPSGKCRIMGCKWFPVDLPYGIQVKRMQSATVTLDLKRQFNLKRMSYLMKNCQYEPELFPALRLMDFKPLCVNLFASGKVTILGLRRLNYKHIVKRVYKCIHEAEEAGISQVGSSTSTHHHHHHPHHQGEEEEEEEN
jgi:TATA-box binding protein (TBP) (component of TFIID and TFIIIB)